MPLAFTKMQGAGNDFVIIDARRQAFIPAPARIRALADRHFGIGCDQLILLGEGGEGADLAMRIFNPDGSEAGACGNATRCVMAWLEREEGRREARIATAAGVLAARSLGDGRVTVDMGPPRLAAHEIPLAAPLPDTARLPLAFDSLEAPAACSMGNPHVTFFLDTLEGKPLERWGAALEHHPLFPERVNVGFAQILSPRRLRLVVWERGAGRTLACGSGACAALVNAVRRGLAERRAEVILDGGTLELLWREDDGHVLMTGPAAFVFEGTLAPSFASDEGRCAGVARGAGDAG